MTTMMMMLGIYLVLTIFLPSSLSSDVIFLPDDDTDLFRWPCDSNCNGQPSPNCNSTCGEYPDAEIYPRHAHCDQGRVKCDKCFESQSRQCVQRMALNYNQPCSSDCDCDQSKRLQCRHQCTCPSPAHMFHNGFCVKREFGDPCDHDIDCQVYGSASEGFTYSGGSCRNHRCRCGDGYFPTRASFVNITTGFIFTKTICVIQGTTTDVEPGGVCALDPIFDSDNPKSTVCAAGATCFRCPEEEFTSIFSTDGKCRKFFIFYFEISSSFASCVFCLNFF